MRPSKCFGPRTLLDRSDNKTFSPSLFVGLCQFHSERVAERGPHYISLLPHFLVCREKWHFIGYHNIYYKLNELAVENFE